MNITIETVFTQDELCCSIYKEELSEQIYRCVNGPHYYCGTCNEKLLNKGENECAVCRHPEKMVRELSLEQKLEKYKIQCPLKCGKNIFSFDTEHVKYCDNAPIKCLFCSSELKSSKCVDILGHFQNNFCSTKFDINLLNLTKNKFKLKLDNKPTIVVINKIYTIFIVKRQKLFHIIAISDSEEYINKKINLTISNNKISFTNEITIIRGKNMKYGFSIQDSTESIIFELNNNNNFDRNPNNTSVNNNNNIFANNSNINSNDDIAKLLGKAFLDIAGKNN